MADITYDWATVMRVSEQLKEHAIKATMEMFPGWTRDQAERWLLAGAPDLTHHIEKP